MPACLKAVGTRHSLLTSLTCWVRNGWLLGAGSLSSSLDSLVLSCSFATCASDGSGSGVFWEGGGIKGQYASRT